MQKSKTSRSERFTRDGGSAREARRDGYEPNRSRLPLARAGVTRVGAALGALSLAAATTFGGVAASAAPAALNPATGSVAGGVSVDITYDGTRFALVAAGSDHSVALAEDGTVWAWGDNSSGQLGNGSSGPDAGSSVPVRVSGLDSVTNIAVGDDHSVALKKNGEVWAWGDNTYGQLGNRISGDGEYSDAPVQVTGAKSVTAIAAGGNHSLALMAGRAFAWGANEFGQLGNSVSGPDEVSSFPVVVNELDSVTAIAAGGNHSVALVGGKVWAWGYNAYGQLGNGPTGASGSLSSLPVEVVDGELGPVTAIAAGGNHSVALSGGKVWAWGFNNYGQLGNGRYGPAEYQSLPVKVVDDELGSVTAIAAGGNHSLALSGGKVWAWGGNSSGQVGSNGPNTILEPVRVADDKLDLSTAIAAGGSHSVALTADGAALAWGKNTDGQLGNGSGVGSSAPVRVSNVAVPVGVTFDGALVSTMSTGVDSVVRVETPRHPVGTVDVEVTTEYPDGTPGPTTRILEGFTYTAVITFDSRGGSDVSPLTVSSASFSMPDDPHRDGFVFEGWSTRSDSDVAWDPAVEITGDFTLYAQWEAVALPPADDSDGGDSGDSDSDSGGGDSDSGGVSVTAGSSSGVLAETGMDFAFPVTVAGVMLALGALLATLQLRRRYTVAGNRRT